MIVMITTLTSTSNIQSIESLMAINFILWRWKWNFLAWKRLVGIISKDLLSLETEFGKLVPKGSIHEHQFFIKRKKLFMKQYSRMLLIFSCIIQHMQRMQKKLGTTFMQHLKNDMLVIDCNYINSFPILRWRKTLWCKLTLMSFAQLINIFSSNF